MHDKYAQSGRNSQILLESQQTLQTANVFRVQQLQLQQKQTISGKNGYNTRIPIVRVLIDPPRGFVFIHFRVPIRRYYLSSEIRGNVRE